MLHVKTTVTDFASFNKISVITSVGLCYDNVNIRDAETLAEGQYLLRKKLNFRDDI
jgi:hypothetical protein